jgi:hypothetical protein
MAGMGQELFNAGAPSRRRAHARLAQHLDEAGTAASSPATCTVCRPTRFAPAAGRSTRWAIAVGTPPCCARAPRRCSSSTGVATSSPNPLADVSGGAAIGILGGGAIGGVLL